VGLGGEPLAERLTLVRSVQDFRESKPASNRRRSILRRRQPRSHAFARCRFCRQMPREMASPEMSRALSSRARPRRIATELACSFVSVLTVVGRRIRHSKDGVSASSIVYRIKTNSEMTNWSAVCFCNDCVTSSRGPYSSLALSIWANFLKVAANTPYAPIGHPAPRS